MQIVGVGCTNSEGEISLIFTVLFFFLMRNYFLLLLVVSNIFILKSANAWGGYTWPYFVPREGTMCPYMEPSDSNPVDYYPESCLKWADPTTFGKFRKWRLLFGKQWWDLYIDKNALYFHPMNGEWERIEMDTKDVSIYSKGWRNYLEVWNELYYFGLPLWGIVKVRNLLSTEVFYLGDQTIIITDTITKKKILYHNWIPNEEIDAENLEKDTRSYYDKLKDSFPYWPDSTINMTRWDYNFYILGNTIFFPDLFTLHRIDNIDLKTFRKNGRFWYQDKNKFYRFIYGHYGFEIVTKAKNIQKH